MTTGPLRTSGLLAAVSVLACFACSSAKQAPAKHDPAQQQTTTLQPRRDQVRFYERPATLDAVRTSGEPIPAVVLIQRDAWADVLGSDSPLFALYEDGTVIWRKANGFRATRLSPSGVQRLIGSLNPDALRALYGRYQGEQGTDQPEEDLLLYRGDKPTFISVYGSLDNQYVRTSVPALIATAYDWLKAFNPPSSAAWLPERIEVMLWPYEYAPDASVEWPKDLPDLRDARTVKRGDSFSIFVPSSKLQEVRALLARRKEKGAIKINGRKWAAGIRFPFPTERLWMAPNPEIAEQKR